MENSGIKYPHHRNCTYIMERSKEFLKKAKELDGMREWKESTHGCWCSCWKEENGEWKIWRDRDWRYPKKGELKFTKN